MNSSTERCLSKILHLRIFLGQVKESPGAKLASRCLHTKERTIMRNSDHHRLSLFAGLLHRRHVGDSRSERNTDG